RRLLPESDQAPGCALLFPGRWPPLPGVDQLLPAAVPGQVPQRPGPAPPVPRPFLSGGRQPLQCRLPAPPPRGSCGERRRGLGPAPPNPASLADLAAPCARRRRGARRRIRVRAVPPPAFGP